MIKKKKITKKKNNKYYAVVSINRNFLYGAFPFSEEGYSRAQEYLKKIDPSKKNFKIVKH